MFGPKNPCPLCPDREAMISDLRKALTEAYDRIIALTDKPAYRQLHPREAKDQTVSVPSVPIPFSPGELRNTIYTQVDPAHDEEFKRVEEMEQ